MSDEISAGTVKVKLIYEIDNDQLRAVAAQGRAEIEQQMAGINVGVAASSQAGASRGQIAPDPGLLSSALPPVATGAGGGTTSSAMAQATRQARLDASRARMTGGRPAQIDSLIRSAQAIGGQAGEWLETAATMMFAQQKEAFTRSAQSSARKAESQVARDKNAINRVALQDSKAVSGALLTTRNLEPDIRSGVLSRAQELRTEYGVDYRTSVSAALSDYNSAKRVNEKAKGNSSRERERRVQRYERNTDLAGLAQQKLDEKAADAKQKADQKSVVSYKQRANQLELDAEKERAQTALRTRDLTKDQRKSIEDRARDLQKEHGGEFKDSFKAALGEFNKSRSETAAAGRQNVDQFLADISDQSPGSQRREIGRYLAANEGMDPRDRTRLERQRGSLWSKTPLGQFLGPPSTMGLMLNTMFGGIEVGHGMLAYGRGLNATSPRAQYEAYSKAADAIAGGFLGSFANMVSDPVGSFRDASAAIVHDADAADARGLMRRGDASTMRISRLATQQTGEGTAAQSLSDAKGNADALRDKAEEARAAHDKQTDDEAETRRQALQASRSRRVTERYDQLQASEPHETNFSGTGRIDRLLHKANEQVDAEDDKAIRDLRAQRGGERDKVVNQLKDQATAEEKAARDRVAYQQGRAADSDDDIAAVLYSQNALDPIGAQRNALSRKQDRENDDLAHEFKGISQDDPLYKKRSDSLNERQRQEREAMERDLRQQTYDMVYGNDALRDSLAANSTPEGRAARAAAGRRAIDAEMHVSNRTADGALIINGIAPGEEGYEQQKARYDLRNRAADRDEHDRRFYEDSSVDDLNRSLGAEADQLAYNRSTINRNIMPSSVATQGMSVGAAGIQRAIDIYRNRYMSTRSEDDSNAAIGPAIANTKEQLSQIRDTYKASFRGEQYDFNNMAPDAEPQTDVVEGLKVLQQQIDTIDEKIKKGVADAMRDIVKN